MIELATVYAKSLNVIAMSITTIIVDADKLKDSCLNRGFNF